MLKELSDCYHIKFSENQGKAIIASLLGGFQNGLIGRNLLKAVPIIGLPASVVSSGAFSSGLTYAVGRIFVMLFEAGGTLLNFDPSAFTKYLKNNKNS